MASINVTGREIEIFCSTEAVCAITEKCGSLTKLSEWLSPEKDGEQDTALSLKRVIELAELLAEAAVRRHNFAVKAGFEDGEEKKSLPIGTLAGVLTIKDTRRLSNAIVAAISESMSYEIPDGVNITTEAVDKTLEEIKDNRAKN